MAPGFAWDDVALHLHGIHYPVFDAGGRAARRSFSYHRLPRQLLRLSVLKLDGTSFEVLVPRTASVSELKVAVEQVFDQLPLEAHGKISWSHVWGHFCLCYQGIRLVNEKFSLGAFGIKDGDQLYFTRYPSMNNSGAPKTDFVADRYCKTSLTGFESYEANGNLGKHNNGSNYCQGEEQFCQSHHGEESGLSEAHFWGDWLSYTRKWCLGKRRLEERSCPSRIAGASLKNWTNGYTTLKI